MRWVAFCRAVRSDEKQEAEKQYAGFTVSVFLETLCLLRGIRGFDLEIITGTAG